MHYLFQSMKIKNYICFNIGLSWNINKKISCWLKRRPVTDKDGKTTWRRHHSIAVRLLSSSYYYLYIFCVNPFTPIDPICRSKMTWTFPWDVLCRSFKLCRFRCLTILLRVCNLQKCKTLEFLRRSEKTASKMIDLVKSYSILNIFFFQQQLKAFILGFIRYFIGPISVHDLQIQKPHQKIAILSEVAVF